MVASAVLATAFLSPPAVSIASLFAAAVATAYLVSMLLLLQLPISLLWLLFLLFLLLLLLLHLPFYLLLSVSPLLLILPFVLQIRFCNYFQFYYLTFNLNYALFTPLFLLLLLSGFNSSSCLSISERLSSPIVAGPCGGSPLVLLYCR